MLNSVNHSLRTLTDRDGVWLVSRYHLFIWWVFDAYLLIWIYSRVFRWCLTLKHLLACFAGEALQNRVSVVIFPSMFLLQISLLLFFGFLWLIVRITFTLTFKLRRRRVSESLIIARLLSRYFTPHRYAPTFLTLRKFIAQLQLWCFVWLVYNIWLRKEKTHPLDFAYIGHKLQ